MLIPPQYQLTNPILKLIQEIQALKTKFDLLPQSPSVEKFARQKSILKSAVFSARIEGNPYTLNQVSRQNIKSSKNIHKSELNNLYKAQEYILSRTWEQSLSVKDIMKIHSIVLSNLSPTAGKLRRQPSAIYNQAGVTIYVCPMPPEIPKLLGQWLQYVNQSKEPVSTIKAAAAHFSFEKIHPFLDGNGRVGRLLIHAILKKHNFDLRGLVAFEQFLDENRQEYYDLLNQSSKNITDFVEFFLKSIKQSLQSSLKQKQDFNNEDFLAPRRHEILNIIRDHQQVSFDFIHRRFIKIPRSSLHHDLSKLCQQKFIKKRGITRGAVYEST